MSKADTKLMNKLATESIMADAMEDKVKQHEQEQKQQNEQPKQKNQMVSTEGENFEDDDDIFKMDEDEEKMMNEIKNKMLIDQGLKPKQGARDRSREKKPSKYKYGEYREIQESEFLDTLLKNKNVICHFYHPEFEKCKVMDKHLRKIAYDHSETLFVKIDANKTPFFSVKLNIKTLPTVIFSKDGQVNEKILGFEGLEGIEDFKTINLVRKLVLAKMIKPKNNAERGEIKIKKRTKLNNEDFSEDEDEDEIDY